MKNKGDSMNIKEFRDVLNNIIKTKGEDIEICVPTSDLSEFTNRLTMALYDNDYYMDENERKIYKTFLVL